jgi:hypothetical protein
MPADIETPNREQVKDPGPAGGEEPNRTQASGPKLPDLGNLAWFAMGMVVAGVVGTVGFYAWLQHQIVAQVQSQETIQYLMSQNSFKSGVTELVEPRIGKIEDRLNNARLVAEQPPNDSFNARPWGCGDNVSVPADSLYVMHGISFSQNRCGSGNVYFARLKLDIPK